MSSFCCFIVGFGIYLINITKPLKYLLNIYIPLQVSLSLALPSATKPSKNCFFFSQFLLDLLHFIAFAVSSVETTQTHTRTHAHTYIYILLHMYLYRYMGYICLLGCEYPVGFCLIRCQKYTGPFSPSFPPFLRLLVCPTVCHRFRCIRLLF